MKAIMIRFMMIVSVSILFSGCLTEELEVELHQDYIDFISNESYESQALIIEEAARRMDRFVHNESGKFIILSFDYKDLNISFNVYKYMLSMMEAQNAKLKSTENLHQIDDKFFISYSVLHSIPTLRTGDESSGGGVDACFVEFSWYATHVYIYISNGTLRYSSYASTAAAIIASSAPEPIASKAVAAACGLTSLACSILRDEYPNGIKISIMVPAHIGPCIPYNLTSQ